MEWKIIWKIYKDFTEVLIRILSELRGVTFAGPVVDDDRKSLMAAIANCAAMNDGGEEKYQSGKKNDKRGGEALVVMDPGEEMVHRNHSESFLIERELRRSKSERGGSFGRGLLSKDDEEESS